MRKNSILLLSILCLMSFSLLSCKKHEEAPTITVTDIDGNVYKTVKIGSQTWMAENLKVTRSNDGGPITSYAYAEQPWYINTYGRLYNWPSALKVCPKGWHLPKDQEWFTLLTYLDASIKNPDSTGSLGKQTGGVLKAVAPELWQLKNEGATNSTGFSALPSGYYENGSWYYIGAVTAFWSATEGNSDQAFGGISLSYDSPSVFRGYMNKNAGHCVRCLQD